MLGSSLVTRRAWEWFLLDADRLVVAGLVVAATFGVVSLPPVGERLVAWSSGSTDSLFGALLSGNLTLVTVVLSINQLVLSRELRTPDEVRTDMREAIAFRDDVAAKVDRRVESENLSRFLFAIVSSLRASVASLDATTASVESDERRESVAALAADLESKTLELEELLAEPDTSLFTALSTALRYDFAVEFDEARWLADGDEPPLADETAAVLAEIQRSIRQFETARQYAKTLYVQGELASLSRLLLYVGTASITGSVIVIGTDAPPVGLPATLALRVAITAALAPLAVLLSYVLRVATVAQRTAAFVPFGSPV